MDPVAVVEKLYDTVSGHTRRYVDNTLDFVRKINKEDRIEIDTNTLRKLLPEDNYL
jgi:hypothetical protein